MQKERDALQRLHDEYRRRLREEAMRDKMSESDDEIVYIHSNHEEGS